MRLLVEADVPCGPVNTLDKALADPQVAATDMVVTIEHGSGARIKQTGNPIKMSGTPSELKTKFTFPPLWGKIPKNFYPGFWVTRRKISTDCGRRRLYNNE